MGQIYFTSDTHYGHKNIVRGVSDWEDKSQCRNFDSIDEMNEVIVQNINKIVKPEDTLYHLGDWSLGGMEKIAVFRYKLKCKNIHLILGNHDTHLWKPDFAGRDLFTSIKGLDIIKLPNGFSATLCHFALRTWVHQSKGTWMLYGHSHNNLPPIKIGNKFAKTMDVGMDTHPEFRPYHLDEIHEIMKHRISPPNDWICQ